MCNVTTINFCTNKINVDLSNGHALNMNMEKTDYRLQATFLTYATMAGIIPLKSSQTITEIATLSVDACRSLRAKPIVVFTFINI